MSSPTHQLCAVMRGRRPVVYSCCSHILPHAHTHHIAAAPAQSASTVAWAEAQPRTTPLLIEASQTVTNHAMMHLQHPSLLPTTEDRHTGPAVHTSLPWGVRHCTCVACMVPAFSLPPAAVISPTPQQRTRATPPSSSPLIETHSRLPYTTSLPAAVARLRCVGMTSSCHQYMPLTPQARRPECSPYPRHVRPRCLHITRLHGRACALPLLLQERRLPVLKAAPVCCANRDQL